jgi:hypothetical protein
VITDRSLLPTRIANSASRRSRRRALARAPVVAALALLSSPLATCVEAQRTAAIVAGVTLNSGSPHVSEPKLSSNGEHATGDRAARVSHDALVGAGVGALVGLVASPILNAQNSDHTEDAMTYVVLVSFGAFVGLVAGTIYGLTRGP